MSLHYRERDPWGLARVLVMSCVDTSLSELMERGTFSLCLLVVPEQANNSTYWPSCRLTKQWE